METPLTSRPTILAVDDSADVLAMMNGLLKNQYRVKVANSGEKALAVVAAALPDLILLDIMMPGMDGYEVCRQLKADPYSRDIPIIFLTARSESEDEIGGFELGAVDYITKPISPPRLLARVKTHLTLKAAADFLKDRNVYLEQEVAKRTREVQAIQDVTITTIASLAESRDNETGKHIRRTQIYIRMLAEQLQHHVDYRDYLTEHNITLLYKSAPLHDIGKVGIPDHILLKPAQLSNDEFETMKEHCAIGLEAIERAESQLGLEVDFLKCAKEITSSHHEKWDGSGYPRQLAGSEIPISARLMAVADVYDSLVSHRVYRPALSHDTAVSIILDGKGKHFDPQVVDAFCIVQHEFARIAVQYADEETVH